MTSASNLNTKDYLTIEALEDELSVSFSYSDYAGTRLYYSLDGEKWTVFNSVIELNAGQSIIFKGYITTTSRIGSFSVSKNFNLKGNIMSLIFGDSGKDNLDLSGYDSVFDGLFEGEDKLISVSENFLPATTLAANCYYEMFYGCTSLTTAPTLPATTLAANCYYEMFYGCTSLTTAPTLPATTLAEHCYGNMFYGCTSLTTAPTLPATTLAEHCYGNMFYGCTSLTTAPTISATTLATNCCHAMFRGCTSLTTAYTLPATTLAMYCYYQMFYGCTSLTTAPTLPATTLAANCYYEMFYGCTSLTTAPTLPATTLVSSCYYQMFYNCKKLNYIKALFMNVNSLSYTRNWVYGVSKTGTFVRNKKDTSLPTYGDSGIPENWTIKTE